MIRRAEIKDIEGINKLLYQVNNIHAKIRSDIFIEDQKKYSDIKLKGLIKDDYTPIFVYTDGEDNVIAYCFCVLKTHDTTDNLKARKELYIDDLCVDENHRRQHIGKSIFEYVLQYAQEKKFDSITINVWEHNDRARSFYDKLGFGVLKTTLEKKLS